MLGQNGIDLTFENSFTNYVRLKGDLEMGLDAWETKSPTVTNYCQALLSRDFVLQLSEITDGCPPDWSHRTDILALAQRIRWHEGRSYKCLKESEKENFTLHK